jgi:hypothetical protein
MSNLPSLTAASSLKEPAAKMFDPRKTAELKFSLQNSKPPHSVTANPMFVPCKPV